MAMAARGSGLAALKIELELDDALEFVEPEELAQLLADGGIVVDVRTEEERADGFIAGSLHAPSEEWANEVDLVSGPDVLVLTGPSLQRRWRSCEVAQPQ